MVVVSILTNSSQNKAEVDENTELLRAVFEKVVKGSEYIVFDILILYIIMYMRVNQVVAGNVRKRLSEESPGSIEQE